MLILRFYQLLFFYSLERPPLASILRQVKTLPVKQEALPIFNHLLEALKDKPSLSAFVLSYTLPSLASIGEWSELEDRLQSAKNAGITVDMLRPVAFANIKTAYEQAGRPLPDSLTNWQAPTKK